MSTNETHEPVLMDDAAPHDQHSNRTRDPDVIEVPTPRTGRKQRSNVTFQDDQKVNNAVPPPGDGEGPHKDPPLPATGMPDPVPPEFIRFTKDVEQDGVGFKAVIEGLSNPMSYNAFRAAFRSVAFVSFPLLTISIHPNTMFKLKFPALVIAAVISTSTHRPTLGEQIGFHSWIFRSLIYCLCVGSIVNTWHIHKHIPAWYGLIAATIFGATLCSNGAIRRFMYLHVFVYLMQIRMYTHYFGVMPYNNAAFYAADHMIGSLMGQAALLFPYPVLISKMVDTIMGKIFEGVGKMLMAMVMFLWSPDPHAASYFYNDKSPFDKVETILAVMPALLWFCNWEPLEFLIRNNVRRLKLSLLRRIMSLTYAAFSAGQTVINSRKEQADRVALQRLRLELFNKSNPNKSVEYGSNLDKDGHDTENEDPLGGTTKTTQEKSEKEKDKEEAKALRINSAEHAKAFAMCLAQTVGALGTVNSKPKDLLEKVPFDTLDEKDRLLRRNLRLEQLQTFARQRHIIEQRKREEKEREKESKAATAGGSPSSSKNSNAPYGAAEGSGDYTRQTTEHDATQDELEAIRQHQSIIDDAEVFIVLSELFFHVIMAMIAAEIQSFKELMEDYKPTEGVCVRLWKFLIRDPWISFFQDCWHQIVFSYPHNFRLIKDAIKMTCAFLSACAMNFEIWNPSGAQYFFGTTILLGLPQDEESLGMAVNRLAGNTLACAVGYLAYHNTKNLSEKIGCILPFQFFFFLFRNHPVFGQTFFYAAVICTAGLVTSVATLELLIRVLASAYTVFAYYVCLTVVFPYSPMKILWNNRCKLLKAVSETIDDAVATVGMEIEYDPDYNHEQGHNLYFRTDALEMCSHLNLELSLMTSILHACEKWCGFASNESVVRGVEKYPSMASHLLLCTEQRWVAGVKLLVFGVQLLHRPRNTPADPKLTRLLARSVTPFLNDFAGAMRLVNQDVIDSIQQCRKWSYPNHLRLVSYLARLKPRLYSILFELYVVLGKDLTSGVDKMDDDDYKALQEERERQRDDDLHVKHHDDDDVEQEGQSSQVPSGKQSLSSTQRKGVNNNASFADQFLQKRYFDAASGVTPASSRNPSFAMSGNYRHNAKLREAETNPQDMYPITQENPELDMTLNLRKKQEEEEKKVEENISKNASFVSMKPKKSKSKLIAEKRGFSYVPVYEGPQFSYHEDELGLPLDTDFIALVSILASCNNIIYEVEGSTGWQNTVSGYHKQLHETTLILKIIDKVSDRLKATREKNRKRYHPLPPTADGRTKMITQPDTWGDWRF